MTAAARAATRARMADDTNMFERAIAVLKDALTALRDGLIVLVFLLLLVAPTSINQRLTEAGFTEGSVAGLKWKAVIKTSSEQARSAGQQLSGLDGKLGEYGARLAALEAEATDPALKTAIKQLGAELRDTQEKARLADRAVKNSVLTQQHLMEKVAPASAETHGWIYVGTASEDKQRWTSSATVDVRPPNVQPGAVLRIRDEVYLRKDSGGGPHSAAPIAAVLGVGSAIEVRHVEYTRADGGWLVWADVTRHVST